MVNKAYHKDIRRTMLGSMGRYIAILAIVALGVGFFVGVKDTKVSMIETCDKYVSRYSMYDFELVSSWGFTDDDVSAMNEEPEVKVAEGSVTRDFYSFDGDGDSIVLRAHSLTDDVNNVNVEEGRLPEKGSECVVDDNFFSAADIGKSVQVATENDKDTKKALKYDEYEIVGIVNSPLYIMKTERGTGSLGDGHISAYVCLPEDGFDFTYYTEIYLTCEEGGYAYSDEYNENIESAEEPITEAAEERGDIRYDEVIDEAEAEIKKNRKELREGQEELDAQKEETYAKLESGKTELDAQEAKLTSGEKEIDNKESELETQKEQLTGGISEAESQLAALKASGMADEATIAAAEAQIKQLESNLKKVNSGIAQLEDKKQELTTGKQKVSEGYDEYYSGLSEAEAQFDAAQKEIDDGKKELKKAEKKLDQTERPELYVQTRDDNIGYDSFDSNSDIVDSIAKIFPVFFFLIAALVCSTTMTRMVEEERGQIGAMRAMGYTKSRIMWKYMVYSGSAAVIGCAIGFFAGSKYFPYAIWIAYSMMFGFAPLEYYFNGPLAIVSLFVAIACSVGTTYLACRAQLRHMPAQILRPPAPKAGKRIFLERIRPIWSRMRFLHKVTARNIFRYKKRLAMMIMGIGGCTALVVAGFGINDSVAGIADHQFTEIERYDMLASFSEEITDKRLEKFEEKYASEIENIAVLQETAVTAKNAGVSKSCTLMVSDDEHITSAVSFKDDEDKDIAYPDTGECVINNKLAEMIGAAAGDKVKVEYDDTKQAELTISGIYRNYVSNYIYVNAETYTQIFEKDYEPSVAFITFAEGADAHEASERINNDDQVAGISLNSDVRSRVDDMMVSLNYIIILVIGCAGALAFIVLFNLGNINITEREREIATIKVLGFFPRETGSYVFRENFILVIIGIVVGLPVGLGLHKFIMHHIVVDAVSFNEVIELKSYAFSVVVVIAFALIVDMIMRRKLKKINMAEALKSIE